MLVPQEQVKAAFSSRNYHRADALLTELLLKNPQNTFAFVWVCVELLISHVTPCRLLLTQRGQCRTEMAEQRHLAYEDFDAILGVSPEHAPTWFLRSVVSRKLGRQATELDDLELAVGCAAEETARDKYTKRLDEATVSLDEGCSRGV